MEEEVSGPLPRVLVANKCDMVVCAACSIINPC
jgi:hypothetical protein